MTEYIIVNKTAILERIEELKNNIDSDDYCGRDCDMFLSQIEILEQILSQSIPLIPEVGKALEAGREDTIEYEDYISNLKLDI